MAVLGENITANVVQDDQQGMGSEAKPDDLLNGVADAEATIADDSSITPPAAVAEEAPKKPTRRKTATPRKRTPKKKASDEADAKSVDLAGGETSSSKIVGPTEADPAVAEQSAAPESVKKPRRRRKKAEPVVETAVAPDADQQSDQSEMNVQTTSKKATAAPMSDVTPPASENTVETAAVNPGSAPQVERQIIAPPEAAQLSSEPEVPVKPAEPEVAAKPKKRGWWSLGK